MERVTKLLPGLLLVALPAYAAAPVFTSPAVNPAENGYVISGQTDIASEVAAVACLPARTAPSAIQIFAQTCGDDLAADGNAGEEWAAATPDSFTLPVLSGLPRHDVYVAAKSPEPSSVDNLETYAAISGKTSDRWTVTASQGTPESSPVQEIDNSDFSENSAENHWTQFSFTGASVEVVVADLVEDVTTCTIRPTRDAISTSVDTGADTCTFTITAPGQYYVDTGEDESPLFVFASAIDEDVPVDNGTTIKTYTGPGMDLTGVTTLVFDPGVQSIDYGTNNGGNPCDTAAECSIAERTVLVVACPMELYIKGGAWVNGQVRFTGGTGACELRGRGTLAGGIYENTADVPVHSNLVYMVNHSSFSATTLTTEGITLAETPGPIHRSNDNGLLLRDVKFFGSVRESGSLRLNGSSLLEDSFFKANDDNVNLFGSNITVNNIVHWAQQTGCQYMLSWQAGEGSNYTNNVVTEVDVIANSRVDGVQGQLINAGVVCSRNVDGGDLSNQTFSDFSIEVAVFQLFAFTLKWDSTGFTDGVGSYADMHFEDWDVAADSVNSRPNGWFNSGVVAGFDPDEDLTGSDPGTITGFTFENITINGSPLVEADLLCEGLANCASFTITP